jgi:hypothetical protein
LVGQGARIDGSAVTENRVLGIGLGPAAAGQARLAREI